MSLDISSAWIYFEHYEGWEESDEDDPVEDLVHRERIRERALLR